MDDLTDEQMDSLVAIIRDNYGSGISRRQFNNEMLLVFEDVPGFESLTMPQFIRLLNLLWVRYRAKT